MAREQSMLFLVILIILLIGTLSIIVEGEENEQIDSANQSDCPFLSSVNCEHKTIIQSTETLQISTGIPINIVISANGSHIIYTSDETMKYELYNISSNEVQESDFIRPDESYGLDIKSGFIFLRNETACIFLAQTGTTCDINNIVEIARVSSNSTEGGFGAWHSTDFFSCEFDPHWTLKSECEDDDEIHYIPAGEMDDYKISPNGEYVSWFTNYLSDAGHFSLADYDGIVFIGLHHQWTLYENESIIANRSINEVLGGYHIPPISEDDVHSTVWSYDSKLLYIVTCRSIIGLDVIHLDAIEIGVAPLQSDCGGFWDDEVLHLEGNVHVSIDGSTLVYSVGDSIAIVSLVDSSENKYDNIVFILIGIVAIIILFGGIVKYITILEGGVSDE